jgi:hypothetical protein
MPQASAVAGSSQPISARGGDMSIGLIGPIGPMLAHHACAGTSLRSEA